MCLRVVVFDDDVHLLEAMTLFLRSRGYEVVGFSDPSLCPLYLDSECGCPNDRACGDVLITDNVMPRMTGLQFIGQQALRGCKGVMRNKAVMSGSWAADDQALAQELGCKVFSKPIAVQELVGWLKECEGRIDPARVLVDIPPELLLGGTP